MWLVTINSLIKLSKLQTLHSCKNHVNQTDQNLKAMENILKPANTLDIYFYQNNQRKLQVYIHGNKVVH
jgi:hypothetical protein